MLHLMLTVLFLLGLGAMLAGFSGYANATTVFQQIEGTILVMLGALIMAVIAGAACIDQTLKRLVKLHRGERETEVAAGRPDVRASDRATTAPHDEKEAERSPSASHALRTWQPTARAGSELPDLPRS